MPQVCLQSKDGVTRVHAPLEMEAIYGLSSVSTLIDSISAHRQPIKSCMWFSIKTAVEIDICERTTQLQ